MSFKEDTERLMLQFEDVGDISDAALSDDPNAYRPWERQRAHIMWELSCALITRDWGRVRGVLAMEPPRLWDEEETKSGKRKKIKKRVKQTNEPS